MTDSVQLPFSSSAAGHIRGFSGALPENSTVKKFWTGLSAAVIDQIAADWDETQKTYAKGRRQAYFSAEFLQGRALLNNLTNLGLVDEAERVAQEHGFTLTDVLEAEHDAALGNGGLGRLAACFLDSAATLNYPLTGYGLLYRYGLFRQEFDNGFQKELPDAWKESFYPFVIRRGTQQRIVRFDDMHVRAVPHDMPITGYGTRNVGTLRSWDAKPINEFDYDAFNSQRFSDAILEREAVHDLTRVLYPNDTTYAGKLLRVRQQYFFVSASLQEMIDNYIAHHDEDLTGFADYNSVQLNDTHPVLGIPELMRLLMDEHGMGWDDAWAVTTKTFAYTNHTVLEEALEKWDVSIFQTLFWRIWEIVEEIDRRYRLDMEAHKIGPEEAHHFSPVHDGKVHMAWIACYASYSVNGVAAMHTEILKRETLKYWYTLYPERFNNKTNGVTPRRWLRMCNPRLSALLDRLHGSDSWVTDLPQLKNLRHYTDDDGVMQELREIKTANKRDFAAWIKQHQGVDIDPDSIFDTQIKRLHEYKRQLMNVLYILDLYFRITRDGEHGITKRTFIFGAKAAPGYVRAKEIIKLINTVADLVNNDPVASQYLTVVFVENYNVSPAEQIIPSTDISEQISTAGKEASGTSNMKFMMNGALTLGTMDGANVEIVDAVGNDNAFIFGAREEDLPELKRTYNPQELAETVPGLRRVLDALIDGTLDDASSGAFADIRASLLDGQGSEPDVYYVLGDFADYRKTRDQMARAYYDDPNAWAQMCWINICESGRFSSDRTIEDYATQVWKLEHTPIN